MTIVDRRNFLALLGTSACIPAASRLGIGVSSQTPKADVALRISPVKLEIAPGKIIETTGYNGSVPGPILRVREGQNITVEVQNQTSNPELVHFHGLSIPLARMAQWKRERQWFRRTACNATRSFPAPPAHAGITVTDSPDAI